MKIDLITFAAQIVNFTILAVLLYKFLYKPLLKAMHAREQHIADEVNRSETLAQEADKKLAEVTERLRTIQQEREHILSEARDEAERMKKMLENQVKSEMMEKRLLWQQELTNERGTFISELRRLTVESFLKMATKILKDLADADLEEKFLDAFEVKLETLSDVEKRHLAADAEEGEIVVSTSRELSAESTDRIRAAIVKLVGETDDISFRVVPQLLCGIEVSFSGSILSWNLQDYLSVYEAQLDKALENVSVRLYGDEE